MKIINLEVFEFEEGVNEEETVVGFSFHKKDKEE